MHAANQLHPALPSWPADRRRRRPSSGQPVALAPQRPGEVVKHGVGLLVHTLGSKMGQLALQCKEQKWDQLTLPAPNRLIDLLDQAIDLRAEHRKPVDEDVRERMIARLAVHPVIVAQRGALPILLGTDFGARNPGGPIPLAGPQGPRTCLLDHALHRVMLHKRWLRLLQLLPSQRVGREALGAAVPAALENRQRS